MQQQPVLSPLPSKNQADALGKVTGKSDAKRLVEAHMHALRARRQRDLLSEKYLLHIDGAGDLQWADIYEGAIVEIPSLISEFRDSENLLRPIVDNMVAHHTTTPFQLYADSSPDRQARDRAQVDTLWANYLAEQQDFNSLFSEAMYLAAPAGFSTVHGYWRDDRVDGHEPLSQNAQNGLIGSIGPGMIDCFVGNPFDTVFDRAARRHSYYWISYGRLVPADLVRRMFGHLGPQVQNLTGSKKLSSAALYQRIAQDWSKGSLGTHGTAVTYNRESSDTNDELISLVCRETLPGYLSDWPDGRLEIVAVPGEADFRRQRSNSGSAIPLVSQALPAKDFSSTLVYSHHRGDDVHGRPWVSDLDELQVGLNIGISKVREHLTKMANAPIVGPGGALSEDTADIDGYSYMEIEPSLASWRPRVMEWPDSVIAGWERFCESKRRAMYTIGGYHAASQGESPGSRTAYRAILALQQADSSIHGPVNIPFKRSVCDFTKRCWKQMKMYGDIPWLIDIVGNENAYLVEPYVSNKDLSENPPKYKLVNTFGPNPELRAQEVLELMTLKGADGQVFMTTDEARRAYPNQSGFNSQGDSKFVSKRRARTIATKIRTLSDQFHAQGIPKDAPIMDQSVQSAAMQVFDQTERLYPRFRDDNIQANIDTLSEVIQDETASPIARLASIRRQALYYDILAQQAGIMPSTPTAGAHPAPTPTPTAAGPRPNPTNRPNNLQVARKAGLQGSMQQPPQQSAAGAPSPMTPTPSASGGLNA